MPRPIIRAPIDGRCRVCGSTEFTTRNRCKPCNRAIERARRNEDPEKRRARDRERSRQWRRANPHKVREQLLRQLYGLSRERFTEILRAQGDVCALCQNPSSDYCVDHCHVTNRVRGILCRPCNIGIGQFGDRAALLLIAADYVTGSIDVRAPETEAKRIARTTSRVATRADRERAAHRRQTYGLSETEFDDLFEAQGGVCAICRAKEADSVDHCHATGRIRSLLCRACNAGLGFFRDEPQLLRAAAAYLRKPQ
jgi:hypothetical protein